MNIKISKVDSPNSFNCSSCMKFIDENTPGNLYSFQVGKQVFRLCSDCMPVLADKIKATLYDEEIAK